MHQYSRAERLLLRPFPENSENSILMSGNDQHEMFDHLDILGREGDRHKGKAKDKKDESKEVKETARKASQGKKKKRQAPKRPNASR